VKTKSKTEKLASAVKTAAFKSGATLVGIVSAETIDALPLFGWAGNTKNTPRRQLRHCLTQNP